MVLQGCYPYSSLILASSSSHASCSLEFQHAYHQHHLYQERENRAPFVLEEQRPTRDSEEHIDSGTQPRQQAELSATWKGSQKRMTANTIRGLRKRGRVGIGAKGGTERGLRETASGEKGRDSAGHVPSSSQVHRLLVAFDRMQAPKVRLLRTLRPSHRHRCRQNHVAEDRRGPPNCVSRVGPQLSAFSEMLLHWIRVERVLHHRWAIATWSLDDERRSLKFVISRSRHL